MCNGLKSVFVALYTSSGEGRGREVCETVIQTPCAVHVTSSRALCGPLVHLEVLSDQYWDMRLLTLYRISLRE